MKPAEQSEMAAFKVLIVGGSVAGMALANMLEMYGISYELLEKANVIAPQIGASIALMPNGLRILDQMGCCDIVEGMSSPVNKATSFDSQGRPLFSLPDFGNFMETA